MGKPPVLVATRLWPPHLDAVGVYSAHLARTLAGLGHEVACATEPGAETGALEHLRVPQWDREGIGSLAGEAARRRAVVLFQYVPHLYHPRGLPFAAAALPAQCRAAGARVVTVVHETRIDQWWPPHRLALDLLQRRLLARVVRGSDGVVVPCELNRRDVLAAGAAAGRVEHVPVGPTIPPPADLEGAARAGRARWARRDERLVVLLGLSARSRGVEAALDAFTALTAARAPALPLAARLVAVGPLAARDGRRFADLASRARRLGIESNVTWAGELPDRELSEVLAAADAYWHAGGGGLTARSSAAASAFAHGAPVVASRPPVLDAQFADGENLLWVEPRRPRAFAEATRRLWSDASLGMRLRRGALALARGALAWEPIAGSISSLFARIAEEERHAG